MTVPSLWTERFFILECGGNPDVSGDTALVFAMSKEFL